MTGSFPSDLKKRLILAPPGRAGRRFLRMFQPKQRARKPLTAPDFHPPRRLNRRGGTALDPYRPQGRHACLEKI
jgi:hypothetical protein